MINKKLKPKSKDRKKYIYRKGIFGKERLALLISYLMIYPIAIIKALPFFILKGPNKFFNKLKQIENKQKKILKF